MSKGSRQEAVKASQKQTSKNKSAKWKMNESDEIDYK